MPYADTYDRDKDIEILDRLAEAQVAITRCRKALSMARTKLINANKVAKGIKTELFVNRYGAAGYERRANGARKSGEIHAAKCAARRAEHNAVVESQGEHFAKIMSGAPSPALTPEEKRIMGIPITAEVPHASVVPPVDNGQGKPMPESEPRCTNCNAIITTRGCCLCPGVKHRKFKTIVPGPTIAVKHPAVPPYQMEGKIE